MLVLFLISLLIAIPLFSSNISPIQFSRVTSVTFLFSALISFNTLDVLMINAGLSLYSGLFSINTISIGMEIFLLLIGSLILLPWATLTSSFSNGKEEVIGPVISEYSLIVIFTTIGSLFLISSTDLVSIYLAIELQSFAVYILSSLYRNSESATYAGLKYFLLGALSSALILLGSSIIYGYTGLTNLESLASLISIVPNSSLDNPIILGLIIMTIGFLFKISSAPFHNWAPDVYDGVPTIVTTWISIMPKISIFVLLITLSSVVLSFTPWQGLVLLCSLLSLIIGTVVGLAQYRIKRLLTYSTISHVGFMLLALGCGSLDALLFYLIQYTLTSVNMFFVLLAFGHKNNNKDIEYIKDLQGQFYSNPLLALSMGISLFSMAGIPPLIGFFGKYAVLYTAIHNGFYFLSLIGILTSVISAAYYLRIIRILFFDSKKEDSKSLRLEAENKIVVPQVGGKAEVTSIHSYVVAILTLLIMLFILQPSIILNSTGLMAISSTLWL